jgi:hypothetical protein
MEKYISGAHDVFAASQFIKSDSLYLSKSTCFHVGKWVKLLKTMRGYKYVDLQYRFFLKNSKKISLLNQHVCNPLRFSNSDPPSLLQFFKINLTVKIVSGCKLQRFFLLPKIRSSTVNNMLAQ